MLAGTSPQNGTHGAPGHLGKVMAAVQRAGVLSALACSFNAPFARNHTLFCKSVWPAFALLCP